MKHSPNIDGVLIQWGDRLFYPGSRIVKPTPQPRLKRWSGAGWAGELRARIEATAVRRAPQVMVKVTGGGRGMRAIAAHLRYISKNGRLDIEDGDGNRSRGKDALREIADEWRFGGTFIDARNAHYVTCCSQVFDMDGGGMQFVAFEARDPVEDVAEAKHNPFLSCDDMRGPGSSLELYQSRNGGVLPKRLVIHKTTAFKQEEIDGAFDALSGVSEIECIEVGAASCWRGVWLIESGRENPALQAGDVSSAARNYGRPIGQFRLVWVAGNAPEASTKGDYYQGGKSIPNPLQLIRHAGKGPLELIAHEALALTKMDWNNDALYDPVPVSIRYLQRLARTIANVQDLPSSVYPYRLFM